MDERQQVVYVRLDTEIQVRLPRTIPDSEIDENGNLADGKYREAALAAAISRVRGQSEMDVSGYLDIPFHVQTMSPDDLTSMADVFSDANETDVTEVRVE